MSVSAISSTNTASTTSSTSSSTTNALDEQYSSFLTLLCTQLENQSPLDPMDANEFTSQLVSYASLEQQMNISSELSSITSQLNTFTAGTAIGYIGHSVVVEGDTASLEDGTATWKYALDSNASDVTLTVKDSSGNTVWTSSGQLSAGSHTLTWDGTLSDGTKVTSGDYTLSVSATDASGSSIDTTLYTTAKVTGVDNSSGTAILQLANGDTVTLDEIISITA